MASVFPLHGSSTTTNTCSHHYSFHSPRARTPVIYSHGAALVGPNSYPLVEKTRTFQELNVGDGTKRRVFFLDVNPLCFRGSTPSLQSFAHWLTLFFSQVSLSDPVIAVFDGDRGNDYRRLLLPSYKAHRRRPMKTFYAPQRLEGLSNCSDKSLPSIADVLHKCNVPVVKVQGSEADDVVATLVDQVLDRGFRAVIGSPDKDFKQLISESVQIVIPMPEFGRWSFYTLKHYIAQYNCDPSCDLSLRCIMGDDVDGVPGIQHLAPGFGRKTALKLIKKHGSLENLLNAASTRTVGKPYAQDALRKYADFLRKNYQVLSLRRDVEVQIVDEWLRERNPKNDSAAISGFVEKLRPSEACREGSFHKVKPQEAFHGKSQEQ